MNELWERALAHLRSRSARERWLLGGAAALLFALLLHRSLIQPLQADVAAAAARIEALEGQLARATRIAADVRRLQGELSAVESLAGEAQIKDRLESIKPKQGSANPRYPETRVEVSLKGATLAQTVQFLHKIETASMHLIVHSIRIKARPGGDRLLDVSFSVSSFEKV